MTGRHLGTGVVILALHSSSEGTREGQQSGQVREVNRLFDSYLFGQRPKRHRIMHRTIIKTPQLLLQLSNISRHVLLLYFLLAFWAALVTANLSVFVQTRRKSRETNPCQPPTCRSSQQT
jgi:hypothetical protein